MRWTAKRRTQKLLWYSVTLYYNFWDNNFRLLLFTQPFSFPHFYYRSTFFISHLLSPVLYISFLPSVSAEFACTVYWLHAECTQPSARFIRRTRVHASAILRNFAREMKVPVGVEQVLPRTPSSVFHVCTQCMFIRNYPESFPQAACVDCFARNRTRDVDMLAENSKLSIDSKILFVAIFTIKLTF